MFPSQHYTGQQAPTAVEADAIHHMRRHFNVFVDFDQTHKCTYECARNSVHIINDWYMCTAGPRLHRCGMRPDEHPYVVYRDSESVCVTSGQVVGGVAMTHEHDNHDGTYSHIKLHDVAHTVTEADRAKDDATFKAQLSEESKRAADGTTAPPPRKRRRVRRSLGGHATIESAVRSTVRRARTILSACYDRGRRAVLLHDIVISANAAAKSALNAYVRGGNARRIPSVMGMHLTTVNACVRRNFIDADHDVGSDQLEAWALTCGRMYRVLVDTPYFRDSRLAPQYACWATFWALRRGYFTYIGAKRVVLVERSEEFDRTFPLISQLAAFGYKEHDFTAGFQTIIRGMSSMHGEPDAAKRMRIKVVTPEDIQAGVEQ